ncbi:MAG: pirin family protein [Bacteroidia bacterium]|nr:pirin family protein [Bacteroidia bacterium]
MSNLQMIIPEREASVGSFMVGRLLPFRSKRTVGPFAFIDHMGPITVKAGDNMDIGPHPHIGLSTLTFLFEGSIMHRDSIGSEVQINPGAVNWMTAGKGVVHSERSPEDLKQKERKLHGLQIWVALPKDKEDIEPNFTHVEEKDIPGWIENGVSYKLIAGTLMDKKSPVPVYSPLYMLEIKSKEVAEINLGDKLYGESALYILEGSIEAEGNIFEPKNILVAANSKLCSFKMNANSTIYIFGGEAFPEERYIYWNFVSSSKDKINQAIQEWKDQKFPKITGETEFVPFPDSLSNFKLG